MTKDLLETVLNNEQGCLDAVEKDYLQINKCDKCNTELKDNCKKMYREQIDLMVINCWCDDLKLKYSANYLYC